MCGAKPLRSIAAIIRPPLREIIRTDLQLLGDLRGRLAGHQPPYRRELDLPVENTSFRCGHPAFLETVILVFVSHFRGALHKFRSFTGTYGYFAMAPFIFPWVRRWKAAWFMEHYTEQRARFPNA